MSDTHDERGGDEAAVCSTSCDPDCDAVCHEDHVPGRKKRHWPYDCPAANEYFWDGDQFTADAIKRLRGERDEAREQLAAATAELGRVNRRADFLDDALDGMRQQAIEAVVARNAATARAEKAEARLAELGEPEVEYGLQYGAAAPQALRAQDEIAYYRRQRHAGLRVRDVYRAPWRVAADAAQDAQSAPGRVRDGQNGGREAGR